MESTARGYNTCGALVVEYIVRSMWTAAIIRYLIVARVSSEYGCLAGGSLESYFSSLIAPSTAKSAKIGLPLHHLQTPSTRQQRRSIIHHLLHALSPLNQHTSLPGAPSVIALPPYTLRPASALFPRTFRPLPSYTTTHIDVLSKPITIFATFFWRPLALCEVFKYNECQHRASWCLEKSTPPQPDSPPASILRED